MVAFILLIVILGILIFLHELGHFVTAKNRGAYVFEFALGMGPKIFSFKRKNKKDPTVYSLRLFPIGGFCAIAGEVSEDESDVKLKKSDYMCNKKTWERCLILIAGVTMNFLTGIILLFVSGLIWGAPDNRSYLGVVQEGYPVYEAGIREGDRLIGIDGKKIKTWDDITLALTVKHESKEYVFTVRHEDGNINNYIITPSVVKNDEGEEHIVFGIGQSSEKKHGLMASIEYAFTKTASIISSMTKIIGSLFTGKLSLSALSGPVGVYSVVDTAKTSAEDIIFLMAYLSLNLGFINILPFPACDGGRVLFLLIEKFRGKKMNPKIENAINNVGFALLMLLMLIITVKDILNLF